MSEPDEAMVEAVAQVLWEGNSTPFICWADLSEPLREMQYEQARAVLSVPVVRDALAVAATHDAEILRLIDERDEAQEWADRLAAVAGGPDVVGEHSNANSPWANALELLQGERG